MTELDVLAGRLVLQPGAADPVRCERPMVGVAMMRRLTEGRRAALLPDLVGTVFSLCASAQRQTSRRAVSAALGLPEDAAEIERERLALRLHTAREHLQRLALDLPQRVPLASADPAWLRSAPVFHLPARCDAPSATLLQQSAAALPAWLERRLLGLPPAVWLAGWEDDAEAWLSEWSTHIAGQGHPVGQWLQAVAPIARARGLPCRPLAVLQQGEQGLRDLARQLAEDPHFAERPLFAGQAAETGPWTRDALPAPGSPLSLWRRLGSRVAELARLASPGPQPLALGTLRLGEGEALAYSEMSRGLLIHWLRLEAGPLRADTTRAERYRVLAPTEWNFHPVGALAQSLRHEPWPAEEATLAAAALDPCVAFEVAGLSAENGHA
jgi:hypothetical protein